jgi:phage shock protein PspC (stress-responsive transcriptional regulator)
MNSGNPDPAWKWRERLPWRPEAAMAGKLVRKDGMIAGVCAGIADWLGWDVTTVRVLYVVGSIVSAAFPGILVYLILWLVMPKEGDLS